jgi:hypothetical protein
VRPLPASALSPIQTGQRGLHIRVFAGNRWQKGRGKHRPSSIREKKRSASADCRRACGEKSQREYRLKFTLVDAEKAVQPPSFHVK